MTAYLLFPFFLLLTVHFQKLQSDLYDIKYTSAAMMCSSSCVVFLAWKLLSETPVDFAFLGDLRFYVSQVLLIALVMVQIEGRKQCQDNMPLFNFSSFLIISAAPVASFIVVTALPFKNTVEVQYDSLFSMIAMCAITLLLTIVYYFNKLKSGAVTRLHWLILNVLIGTFSIVLHAKLMQEFDSYSYLIATNGINIVVFLLLSLKNKELKQLNASMSNKRNLLVVVTLYCITQFLNTEIVTKIPVEQYVTLRSAGMVLIGYLYYYMQDKRVIFTARDIVLLTSIIATQLYFTG
jgi:hypothetical protein